MKVTLPRTTMYDDELERYVRILNIQHFRCIRMRDELPHKPFKVECGILNLNTHTQQGSHWICWYKNQHERYYFDSFGEPPPPELLRYLKTSEELESNAPTIRRSAVTVQHYESNECGSLCLYMLKLLSDGIPFSTILSTLVERYLHTPTSPLTIKL